jgi:hypothetical protein
VSSMTPGGVFRDFKVICFTRHTSRLPTSATPIYLLPEIGAVRRHMDRATGDVRQIISAGYTALVKCGAEEIVRVCLIIILNHSYIFFTYPNCVYKLFTFSLIIQTRGSK